MSRNRVIGRDGTLPWRLPADMRHFVRLTKGKPVISGRRNFEDIGKPLPKRTNIILTRQRHYRAEGCLVAHSPEQALALAGDAEEIMVIGGEHVYEAFLPLADRIYLTVVEADIEGDTHFPELAERDWELVRETAQPADVDNPHAMRFLEYRPRTAARPRR